VNAPALLADAFGRIRGLVHAGVDNLTEEQLAHRVTDSANSIGWLTWHLTRIQDDHVANVAGSEQVWRSGGWQARFGLPFEADATGFGHTPSDVAQVRNVSAELLAGYYDAVHQGSLDFLNGLTESDLDRIVDTRWDPPVTLGGRLVSVLSDNLQHGGQLGYLRGLLESQ